MLEELPLEKCHSWWHVEPTPPLLHAPSEVDGAEWMCPADQQQLVPKHADLLAESEATCYRG